jgi:hypothetical protein
MSIRSQVTAAVDAQAAPRARVPASAREEGQVQRYVRHAVLFVLVGLVIYVAVYFLADQLVYRTAKRNRFFAVKTAAHSEYDYVILGASRAAALDYEDMTPQLEQMTRSRILNLSNVGSGVIVNRLLLDYFLVEHRTQRIVYVIDSFGFYSREWNEERLTDTKLFDRAPFDPTLASMLFQNPASRPVALDYAIGFSKINNADRFKPDISEDEATKFNKAYRPVKQIDVQRIEYLYPQKPELATFQSYLREFEDLVRGLQGRNIRLIVLKPPLPTRVYNMLPDEAQFDATLKGILDKYNVEYHDFSSVGNDEKFFFNTDHLNRAGVLNFFENHLAPVLARK